MKNKYKQLKFNQKMWLIIICTALLGMIFSNFLMNLSGGKAVVGFVTSAIQSITEKVAEDYQGGSIDEQLKEKVKLLDDTLEWNISLFGDIDIDEYEKNASGSISLTDEEESKFLAGNSVVKKVYIEETKSDSLTILLPLLDQEVLKGVIISDIPMTSFSEVGHEKSIIWMTAVFFFIVLMIIIGVRQINKFIKPIKTIESAAYSVSKGNYSVLLDEDGADEMSNLAKAFNKMAKAIEEEDKRKQEFLADVSHELRTPLTYVKGYTHVLLDDMVQKPEEKRKYLKLIDRETSRLQTILQDLLDLSKLESKTYKVNLQPIVFAQCIEDVMHKYESIIADKNLKLKMNLDPEIIINGDEDRLEQIIRNIVENSIRYSKKDSSIVVELETNKDNCILSIADNGIGMSKEDLQKITERFYRVDKARSRASGGTGLGLSIVEKLMDLHKGKMIIESKLNIGTKVSLIFPLLTDDDIDDTSECH
ncbi:sensor histidine kinase [Bacillus massilioanorexius]|nr:HAMP domain-containing sensor histidine kinase [Bacillus massilioanorexius]